MLPKKYRLTRSSDIIRARAEGKSWSNSKIVLCAVPNGQDTSRFGFSVSRKIGGAVVRNRCKRLLREVVHNHLVEIRAGWDFVIIVRKSFLGTQYYGAEQATLALLGIAEMLIVP